MKKKLKLRNYVVPVLYVSLFVLTFYVTLVVSNSLSNMKSAEEVKDNTTHVSRTIINHQDIPVINEEDNKIVKPYNNEKVSIGRYYYDYKASSDKQQNSIAYHDNTYMQNTGVDYTLEEEFDVLAVLPGEVISVANDELVGNKVEIKHDNDYVSTYESLSAVNVKKGDTVSKGQVIGKSGSNELDKDMGNHLHFEFYDKGKIVDPLLYLDKDINELKKEENNAN